MATDTRLQSYVDENNDVMVDWRSGFQKFSLAAIAKGRVGPSFEDVLASKSRLNTFPTHARQYGVISVSGHSLSKRMRYLSEMKRGRSDVERAREVPPRQRIHGVSSDSSVLNHKH